MTCHPVFFLEIMEFKIGRLCGIQWSARMTAAVLPPLLTMLQTLRSLTGIAAGSEMKLAASF